MSSSSLKCWQTGQSSNMMSSNSWKRSTKKYITSSCFTCLHTCVRDIFCVFNHWSSDVMRPHRSAFTLSLAVSLMWLKLFQCRSAPIIFPPTLTLVCLVLYRLERPACDWKVVGWTPWQVTRTRWYFPLKRIVVTPLMSSICSIVFVSCLFHVWSELSCG